MRIVSVVLILLVAVYLTACAASTTESQFVNPDAAAPSGEVAPSPAVVSPGSTAPPPATDTASAPTDTPPRATDTPPPSPNPTATAPPADTATPAPTFTAVPEPSATPSQPADATTNDGASNEQLVARGIEVYRENFCGTCHTLDAADTHGIFGPTHNGIGTTAAQRIQDADYTGSATTAEAYIRESLVDPNVYHVPGYSGSRFTMPSFGDMDEADLDALVYMLLQQK